MVPSALRAAPGDCAPEYVFETAQFRLVQCVRHGAADTALKPVPADGMVVQTAVMPERR